MAVILPSVYKDGTATVNSGSTTVTGQNTLFVNSVLPGDFFGSSQGVWVRIASVNANDSLTLAHEWPEATQTAAPYEIMLQSDNARMQETSRQLLTTLSSGNNYSLAQLNGNTDLIPIFSAPGVFTLISKSELLSGVNFDVVVDDIAGRAAYDNREQGFTVLVINTGDGRSAVYAKDSATPGDWSNAIYITGPVGPAGYVNLRGTYAAGTAYAKNDGVLYNGSSFVALQTTTGNAPPTLPTTSNAYWQLLAIKGTDGTGIGDMVKAIYDPNNRQSDAFLYDNQTYAGRGCAHVAEGDSLTYGFGVPDPATQSYFAIYGNQKFTEGALAKVNFAVSGSVLYTGGANPSVTSRYAGSVRPYRPTPNGGTGGPRAYLYVTAGTNDIIHGRTAAQIITDLTNYVSTAKADGFVVIVGTITPSTAWNPEQNDRRLAVNAAIRKGAVGANIVWGMDEIINNPSDVTICPDGGHYSVIANVLLGKYLDEGMRGGFVVKQTYGVSESGRPIDPAWELIGNTNAPGGTTSVSWTGLEPYRIIRLRYDIIPSGNTIIGARTSRDNGVTWDSGAGDYTYHGWFEVGGGYNNIATNNISSLPLVGTSLGGNVCEGSLEITPFNTASLGTYHARARLWQFSPVAHRSETLDGYIGVGGARNAIMFYALAGDFSGRAILEGVRG